MDITKLFFTLVQIDSPPGKEQQMSLFLQNWLKKNKFSYRIDYSGNIYADNKKSGIPLLLCGHMDTVQPGENIKPIIKKKIIKSSGNTILGADNKAALAAIMTAVEQNKNKHLELLFTVKEETGGGVEYFPFSWIQAKKALVFDSSNPPGGIVLRSPYICNFHVKMIGKAAHSSQPQRGINALNHCIHIIMHIPVGSLDNKETTINIGLMKAGTGINTIPEVVELSGEIRSYNKELFASHIKKIKSIFQNGLKGTKIKCFFSSNGYCTGYTHNKQNPFIKQIEKIYSSLSLKPIFYSYSGISDANVLMEHGIETVNLTDGTKYTHTTKEQIAVKDLKKLSQIVVSCITNL